MRSIISWIELGLQKLAENVLKRPYMAICGSLCLALLLSAGMSRLYIDVTSESMFKSEDPTLQQYKRFQAQFGRDDAALAVINSPDIFTERFLQKLEEYHRDLEANVPYLDEVVSLVSVTSVTDKDGEILIDDLRNVWPHERAAMPAFKQYVVNNPLYRNLIVSEDGDTTLMVIRASAFATEIKAEKNTSFSVSLRNLHDSLFNSLQEEGSSAGGPVVGSDGVSETARLDMGALPQELSGMAKPAGEKDVESGINPLTMQQLDEFVAAVREVTKRHQASDFPIKLAGGQLVAIEHAESIHSDFMGMLPLTLLLVLIVLFVMMRRWSVVLIPTLIVLLTLTSTFGFMGWLGLPVTPVAVALPPLIIMIGVADSVHMLSIYFAQYNKTNNHNAAIIYSIRRTGLAVLFTSLTTMAGFLSFRIADIKPIADFGFLIAFSVFLALVLTLLLVPAFLSVSAVKSADTVFTQRWQRLVSAMSRLTEISMDNSQKVIVAVILVVALCIPGVMRLHFSHNTLEWFQEDRPIRVNTLAIDETFHGSIPLEVVLDTGKPNGIYSPEFMRNLEEFGRYAENLQLPNIEMGRTTSIVDTLKRIHAVMNNETPADPIPPHENLVAQELLLFESSGASDVGKLIDSQFSKVRITVRLSWTDAVDYIPMRREISDKVTELFGNTAAVTVTGTIDLISRSLIALMQSMMGSYLIAAITIGFMLIIMMRSIHLGLVSMIPNFLPILMSLAVMGYAGIPIDMFSVLLGGIALGLAVDDTVHFMHGYRFHRHDLNLSMKDSIQQTVQSSGPALLFTTVSISLGFFVFVFSTIQALTIFGILLCLTIVNALVLDLMVTPAMIKTVDRLGWFSTTGKEYSV